MAAAFPKKTAAMRFQMAHQIDALHPRLGAQALTDDGHPREVFLDQGAIRLQDKLDRFAKVRAGLLASLALRVGAWELLDERDIAAFRGLPEDGGELKGERLQSHE